MSKFLSIVLVIAFVQASFCQSMTCLSTAASLFSTLDQMIPTLSFASASEIEQSVDKVIQAIEPIVAACNLPKSVLQDLQNFESMVDAELNDISPACVSYISTNATQTIIPIYKSIMSGNSITMAELLEVYNVYTSIMNLCSSSPSNAIQVSSGCISTLADLVPEFEQQLSQMAFVNASDIDSDLLTVENDIDSIITACNLPSSVAQVLQSYVNTLEADVNSLPAQCIPFLNTAAPDAIAVIHKIIQTRQITISEMLKLYQTATEFKSDCTTSSQGMMFVSLDTSCVLSLITFESEIHQIIPELSFANSSAVDNSMTLLLNAIDPVLSACNFPSAVEEELQSFSKTIETDASKIPPKCYSQLDSSYGQLASLLSNIINSGTLTPADISQLDSILSSIQNACVTNSSLLVEVQTCEKAIITAAPQLKQAIPELSFASKNALGKSLNLLLGAIDPVITACNAPSVDIEGLQDAVAVIDSLFSVFSPKCINYLENNVPVTLTQIVESIIVNESLTQSQILNLYRLYANVVNECTPSQLGDGLKAEAAICANATAKAVVDLESTLHQIDWTQVSSVQEGLNSMVQILTPAFSACHLPSSLTTDLKDLVKDLTADMTQCVGYLETTALWNVISVLENGFENEGFTDNDVLELIDVFTTAVSICYPSSPNSSKVQVETR